MDFLSIAGFALNVASYLKENPLDFDSKAEEPVAVAETVPKSRALADIKMPVDPREIETKDPVSRYPKGLGSYQKRTSVGNGGQISMARVQAKAEDSGSLMPGQSVSRPKANSGIDQSGRYFFRKRDL